MDSSSDSEVSSQNMWSLRSKKRLYEDEDMGFNHKKKKKKKPDVGTFSENPCSVRGEKVVSVFHIIDFIKIHAPNIQRRVNYIYAGHSGDGFLQGKGLDFLKKVHDDSTIVCALANKLRSLAHLESYSNGATVNSASCFCALARAKKVEANLSPEFPSCVKFVTRLQVPGGKEQYLVLPKKFCYEHLPFDRDNVVFVDENEKEFSVGYKFKNCRFRVGWKSFSNANRLLKGDVLVFHLIEDCKFKVYIVRSCRPTKVNCAIQNPKKDVLTVTEDARNCIGVKEEKHDLFWDDSDQEDITEGLKLDHTPAPRRDNICSDVFGSIRFSASVLKFQDVKRFEDFKIYVDGLILDSELPVHAKMKYYELCCSRKMFLHERVTGLSSKLVTGMISETSNIADAIQSTSLAASLHNLESWDNTLKAFEDLGMSVGFLRGRIDMLVKISRKYQTISESNSAKFVQVEEKKRALNEKVSSMDALRKSIAALKESIKSLEAEIDGEKEGLGFEFNKIATAPW